MNNIQFSLSTITWVMWFICTIAVAIVVSDGVFMAFLGLPPFFGVVSVWLGQHIWMFAATWIFITAAFITRVHYF
jgi:hypothetical protein